MQLHDPRAHDHYMHIGLFPYAWRIACTRARNPNNQACTTDLDVCNRLFVLHFEMQRKEHRMEGENYIEQKEGANMDGRQIYTTD